MKHFLVYTNVHKDVDFSATNMIVRYLEEKGQRVSVKAETSERDVKNLLSEKLCTDIIPEDIDYILVLGGDGTVLQAVREIGGRDIPMIGINLGTLGYLTEIEPANIQTALNRLIDGDYTQDNRMMLTGCIQMADGRCEEEWSLNDITITRRGPLQIISFEVYVNGLFLSSYSGDGVIVATPTGSTGYNLSAGGPLVSPGAEMILITPICPHTLNQRSILLSAEDVVEIAIPAGREGRSQTVDVNFDGSHAVPISTGDKIRITKSEKKAAFMQLKSVSFLEILRKKMAD